MHFTAAAALLLNKSQVENTTIIADTTVVLSTCVVKPKNLDTAAVLLQLQLSRFNSLIQVVQ
jgi:hypothetical protein